MSVVDAIETKYRWPRQTLRAEVIGLLQDLTLRHRLVFPDDLVEELMSVVDDVQYLALDWTHREHPEIGCLVGTMRMRRGDEPCPWYQTDKQRAELESTLGYAFLDCALPAGVRSFNTIIQIVDAEEWTCE